MDPVFVIHVEETLLTHWDIHIPSTITDNEVIKTNIASKLTYFSINDCQLGFYDKDWIYTVIDESQLYNNLHRLVIRGPSFIPKLGGSQSNCILYSSYEYTK